MILFDGPRNDDNKRKMERGLYLIPDHICESENTSSVYAFVRVFARFGDWEYDNPVGEGYISLGSDNFVVDNY